MPHVPIDVALVLTGHQKNDIKNCTCGKWGSDHGHLGQSHVDHVVEELEKAGYRIVPA